MLYAPGLWLIPLLGGLIVVCSAIAQPPATQPSAGEQTQAYLAALRDGKLDASRRQEAVRGLLGVDRTGAIELLAIELRPEGDAGVQRVIAQALATAPEPPPNDLSVPLFNLMDRADDATLADLAAAVGRYDEKRMTRRLADTANDPVAPIGRRRGAILSLGYHRTQTTARQLIQLAQPAEAPGVRNAAFSALESLAGISDYGSDLSRWQAWWEDRRRMSETQWYEDLLAQQNRRSDRIAADAHKMRDRVIELQRQLYRATPTDARPDLLASMLGDPLEASRQLAVELAVQRLTDTQPITPKLREALLARLDDPAAAIRQGTARILRELADAAGADAVAQRLAEERERDPDVVRAYLLVLARLPREKAVDFAVRLLGDPTMGGEAAAALAKAADAKLLSPEQRTEVTTRLRSHLNPELPPEPRVIELLGKVAQEDDWPRIVRWLDDSDPAVRVAAANAWAQSDRPLRTLADHAADPAIRPVVIEAATRRGDDLSTMLALAKNKPEQDQAVQAWQRALVAMGGRAPAVAVLSLYDTLTAAKESAALREQILSAALTRLSPPASAPTTFPATQTETPPGLADLLLARGELRLAQGDTVQGHADFKRVQELKDSLDARQSQRLRLGFFQVALAASEWDQAFSLAHEIVGASPADGSAREIVIQSFLVSAQRSVTAGQGETALRLTAQVRELAGASISDALSTKLLDLEARAHQAAGEPATATRPATQASIP